MIGTPAIMAILLLAVRPRLTLSHPSLTQVGIRFNTYIGVPLVIAFFYGTDTIALGALFIGFMVPFINVVCVWVLAKYGEGEVKTRGTLGEMARNPLILSCLAGIAVNTSGLGLTVPFETFFGLLGRAAPPVGLLCVGAGLDIVAVRVGRAWVALSAVIKLIAMPLIALAFAHTLGLDSLSAEVLVIFHVPTAPSNPRPPDGWRHAADGGSPHRTDRACDGYPAVVDFAAEGVMSFPLARNHPGSRLPQSAISSISRIRGHASAPFSAISGRYFSSFQSRIPDS